MSTILFSNNASSTLAGAITNTATSLSLAAGGGTLFPAPGAGQYFVMTLVDAATGLVNEILHVTSVVGDVLTIVRAQESTTAKSWLAGDIAALLVTAGSLQALVQVSQQQTQGTNYAADTGAANALAVTLSPVPASLASMVGAPIRVKVANTNTGASTLNVNSLGAIPIIMPNGTPMSAAQLWANAIETFVYDGTAFELESRVGYHDGFSNVQVFTASGTFTVPAGITRVRVLVIAGGGGAGGTGSTNTGGGGGGGGGGAQKIINGLSPGSTVTVTVGAAGVGSSSSGTNGGSSSFGAYCSATGGVAGGAYATLPYGGSGGVGSGGDINQAGSYGGDGSSGGIGMAGNGGSPAFIGGSGGRGGSGGGLAALNFGGGGGGGYLLSAGTAAGANGSPGVVIVEY